MVELVSWSTEAGAQIGEKLRRAYVLFFAGTRRINVFMAQARPSAPLELYAWVSLIHDAEQDLRDCLAVLESGPINPDLLQQEEKLERKRADDGTSDEPEDRAGA